MEVKAIVPRGYCKGVVNAINIAKKASQKQPVYILGMIVHNHKGKTRLELLDDINNGTVIITAHGASDEVFFKARKKGLNVIDASCQDVIKTHDLIKDKLKLGYEILYIGKLGHPEAEGAISINSHKIHLITQKEDILKMDPQKKYIITNQTTMSLYDVYELCEFAKNTLLYVEIAKETCTATKIRQEAIKNIGDDIDIVFIVGDPHSHNTQKLASIAGENKDVYMIESIQDLNINVLMKIIQKHISSRLLKKRKYWMNRKDSDNS